MNLFICILNVGLYHLWHSGIFTFYWLSFCLWGSLILLHSSPPMGIQMRYWVECLPLYFPLLQPKHLLKTFWGSLPDVELCRKSPQTIDHFILPCSTALAQDYYLISTIIATSCGSTLLIQTDLVNKMVLVGDKRRKIYIILHLWELVLWLSTATAINMLQS